MRLPVGDFLTRNTFFLEKITGRVKLAPAFMPGNKDKNEKRALALLPASFPGFTGSRSPFTVASMIFEPASPAMFYTHYYDE
jgi:hypothetical protein